MSKPHSVEEVLHPWLEWLDSELSEQAIKPADRPLKACIFLASNGIVRGPDRPTDDFEFFDELWFAAVYELTEKWFINRYGKWAIRRDNNTVPGLVLIYGTPYRLDIPLTTSNVEEPGETSWLCFPDSVQPEEDAFSWIHEPPDFDAMDDSTIGKLKAETSSVVAHIRSTRLNTMTAEFDEEDSRRNAASVELHLANAVSAICSMEQDRLSISQWEIHLSIDWSVTLYDDGGWMPVIKYGAYSFNNVTAEKNKDGSITIHFGGDPKQPNFLPIVPGWNYIVRMYQPGQEILDGSWTFPDPKPVE